MSDLKANSDRREAGKSVHSNATTVRQEPHPPHPPVVGLAIAFFCVALLGCSSAPNELLHPVSGQVTFGGKPLTTGTVSFRPDASKGNKSEHHPTGTIGADGKFTLFTGGHAGAPPGWYKVVVNAHEPALDTGGAHPGLPKSIIPTRYAGNDTPLAREVLENPAAGAYDLTLEAK